MMLIASADHVSLGEMSTGDRGYVMVAVLFYCLSPRHEDLKMLLDSNKDGQKLDAMKIIIGVSGHT